MSQEKEKNSLDELAKYDWELEFLPSHWGLSRYDYSQLKTDDSGVAIFPEDYWETYDQIYEPDLEELLMCRKSNYLLTMEEYLKWEDRYVVAIKLLLKDIGADFLVASYVSGYNGTLHGRKDFFKKPGEKTPLQIALVKEYKRQLRFGCQIKVDEMDNLIRLNMRGLVVGRYSYCDQYYYQPSLWNCATDFYFAGQSLSRRVIEKVESLGLKVSKRLPGSYGFPDAYRGQYFQDRMKWDYEKWLKKTDEDLIREQPMEYEDKVVDDFLKKHDPEYSK